MEKSEAIKLINNRIRFWKQKKPDNIEISPKRIDIETEKMFDFSSKMIIEELKFIRKQIKKGQLPTLESVGL